MSEHGFNRRLRGIEEMLMRDGHHSEAFALADLRRGLTGVEEGMNPQAENAGAGSEAASDASEPRQVPSSASSIPDADEDVARMQRLQTLCDEDNPYLGVSQEFIMLADWALKRLATVTRARDEAREKLNLAYENINDLEKRWGDAEDERDAATRANEEAREALNEADAVLREFIHDAHDGDLHKAATCQDPWDSKECRNAAAVLLRRASPTDPGMRGSTEQDFVIGIPDRSPTDPGEDHQRHRLSDVWLFCPWCGVKLPSKEES